MNTCQHKVLSKWELIIPGVGGTVSRTLNLLIFASFCLNVPGNLLVLMAEVCLKVGHNRPVLFLPLFV